MSCKNKATIRLQAIELLARIVGWSGTPIITTDISTIVYSAFILHQATGEEVPITGYENLALTPVASYLHDTPVVDAKWTEDDIGYNFHMVAPAAIFTEVNEIYMIRVTFDPANSDPNLNAVFFIEVE